MNSRFVCALDSVYVQAAAEKAQKEKEAAAAAAAPKPEAPKPAAAAPPAPKPAAPAAKKADAEVRSVGSSWAVGLATVHIYQGPRVIIHL